MNIFTNMDKSGGFGFYETSRCVRKKRSIRHRHRQDDSPSNSAFYDHSSLASTPLSDGMSKPSSEENVEQCASFGSENVNQNISEVSETNLPEVGTVIKTKDEGLRMRESNDSGMRKLKTVKLKVGGVTHTLHSKTSSEGSSLAAASATKTFNNSDAIYAKHKLISEDCPDASHHTSKGREIRLRGIPWKDFSRSGFIINKPAISVGMITGPIVSAKDFGNYEPSRKSKRVRKRHWPGEDYEDLEDNSDDEIRYLEKVQGVKYSSIYVADDEGVDEEGSRKQRSLSGVIHSELYGNDVDMRYNSSTSDKESNKSRSVRASEDSDYFEDEELLSDDEPEPRKKKSKEFLDVSGFSKGEMAITTRQRALKSGKSYSSSGASLIEFPHGLPPAPPKKPKEKLSEFEQQAKKAEAAQRRRMQTEKAAQEAEAEAIRKILGQDSSRKKQEDKIKKRQEELAQERAAKTLLPSNSVRWLIGPSGTTVTFPDEIGLPSILESRPLSYPPPRENCAGPSCTNAYKYRDAKSKLPLCSLGCYKAIHKKMPSLASC